MFRATKQFPSESTTTASSEKVASRLCLVPIANCRGGPAERDLSDGLVRARGESVTSIANPRKRTNTSLMRAVVAPNCRNLGKIRTGSSRQFLAGALRDQIDDSFEEPSRAKPLISPNPPIAGQIACFSRPIWTSKITEMLTGSKSRRVKGRGDKSIAV